MRAAICGGHRETVAEEDFPVEIVDEAAHRVHSHRAVLDRFLNLAFDERRIFGRRSPEDLDWLLPIE